MKTIRADELDVMIGQEIGVSDWYEMTQDGVNQFADVTKDFQFIHIDPEKAAQTPFGGPIAHGFYTLSMLSHLAESGSGLALEGTKMGVNYGFDKVRFLNPVPVGSKIRSRSSLAGYEQKNLGQYLLRSEVIVEIEGIDKPALICEWLTMIVV